MPDQIAPVDHQQVGADFLRQQQSPRVDMDQAAAIGDQVYKAMHGFYGSLWLNKFSTGMASAGGGDEGFEAARRMWGFALSRYGRDIVRLALGKCITVHPEFPPSLPQFVALCESCRPREAFRAQDNAIGMSQQLRSSYSRRLREVNAKHLQKARELRSGATTRENDAGLSGLPLLNSLLAEAIGLAGGDEAAALLRLERSQLADREVGTPPGQALP